MPAKAFNSPEELEKLINKYFDYCDSQKEEVKNAKGETVKIMQKPYTISGLCVYLGIHRDTLNEYSHKDEYSDTIKKAKSRVENYAEEGLLAGKLNTIGTIFSLKNNFKWQDKQEIEHTGKVEGLQIIIGNQDPASKIEDAE